MLQAQAILGADAEEFLSSELGRYIAERIEEEIATAQRALEDADVFDTDRLLQLQNNAKRARQLEDWFIGLIQEGRQAIQALEALHAEGD